MAEEKKGLERSNNTFHIKTAFKDTVDASLNKSANDKALFKHIGEYRNKNIAILSSPYPTTNMLFRMGGDGMNGADADIVFKSCGIDKNELHDVIEKAKKELLLDLVGKNVTPFSVALILAMAHYYHDKVRLRLLCLYYVYGFYWSVFKKYFPKFDPNPEVMKYTIDEINNKFHLKKYGSIEKMLDATTTKTAETYADKFANLSDKEIIELCNAFRTRVDHQFGKFFKEYNKNYLKNNRKFTSVETDAEGNQIDRETNLTNIEQLSNQCTTKFFSTGVSNKQINMVSEICKVSKSDLTTSIQLLHNEENIKDVKTFYDCLFYAFFTQYPTATIQDVKSLKFVAAIDQIYKKGNCNDKNINKIKDISHEWLKRGSKTYAATTRAATQNNFRKAIYLYFAFAASSNEG